MQPNTQSFQDLWSETSSQQLTKDLNRSVYLKTLCTTLQVILSQLEICIRVQSLYEFLLCREEWKPNAYLTIFVDKKNFIVKV